MDILKNKKANLAILKKTETITPTKRLSRLESVVDKNLEAVFKVGAALMEIRNDELYKLTHERYADYIRERFGLSKSRLYQYIDAADVVDNLKKSTIVDFLPINEAQMRPLVKFKKNPELQLQIWQEVIRRTPKGGKPTAAVVKQVIKEMTAPPPEPEPEAKPPEQIRLPLYIRQGYNGLMNAVEQAYENKWSDISKESMLGLLDEIKIKIMEAAHD